MAWSSLKKVSHKHTISRSRALITLQRSFWAGSKLHPQTFQTPIDRLSGQGEEEVGGSLVLGFCSALLAEKQRCWVGTVEGDVCCSEVVISGSSREVGVWIKKADKRLDHVDTEKQAALY